MVLNSQGRTLLGKATVRTFLSVLLPAHREVGSEVWVQGSDGKGFIMPGEPEIIYM